MRATNSTESMMKLCQHDAPWVPRPRPVPAWQHRVRSEGASWVNCPLKEISLSRSGRQSVSRTRVYSATRHSHTCAGVDCRVDCNKSWPASEHVGAAPQFCE